MKALTKDANNREIQAFVLGGRIHKFTVTTADQESVIFEHDTLIEIDVIGSCYLAAGEAPDATDYAQNFTMTDEIRTYAVNGGQSIKFIGNGGTATITVRESG